MKTKLLVFLLNLKTLCEKNLKNDESYKSIKVIFSDETLNCFEVYLNGEKFATSNADRYSGFKYFVSSTYLNSIYKNLED